MHQALRDSAYTKTGNCVTDGVHYRDLTGTGPVILKVARWTGAFYSGNHMDQFTCVPLFPYPLLLLQWASSSKDESVVWLTWNTVHFSILCIVRVSNKSHPDASQNFTWPVYRTFPLAHVATIETNTYLGRCACARRHHSSGHSGIHCSFWSCHPIHPRPFCGAPLTVEDRVTDLFLWPLAIRRSTNWSSLL